MNTSPSKVLAGWKKLPDELRLSIVRHALPSDKTISYTDVPELMIQDSTGDRQQFMEEFIVLLYCPATSALAVEALYSQNTVSITCKDHMRLPPEAVRRFIRRVQIQMLLTRPGLDGFATFCSEQATFSGLCRVDLTITQQEKRGERTAITELVEGLDPLFIQAKEVHIQFRQYWRKETPDSSDENNELEALVMDKFAVAGTIVEQHFTRFHTKWKDEQGHGMTKQQVRVAGFYPIWNPMWAGVRETKKFARTQL
jgi:hypothetical protein